MKSKNAPRVRGKSIVYAYVDERLVEEVKKISSKTGISISRLIEEFLRFCVGKNVIGSIMSNRLMEK